MNRRAFLLTLAAGTAASLAACTRGGASSAIRPTSTAPSALPAPSASSLPPVAPAVVVTTPASPQAPTPSGALVRSHPDSIITALPGDGTSLALTVDDGVSNEVVAAYAQFAQDSGARITFFVNGVNPSWALSAPVLRPMVDSGQIQLANHTWDHPDLRSLSDNGIRYQLTKNDQFLQETFGVSGRPFLRPPYGFHNDRVRRIAAEEGYSVITLWYGSLADSSLLTEAQIIANAQQWFLDQHIVIGHANYVPVTHVYNQLLEIIAARNLTMVTLNDVFDTSATTH